MRTAPSARRTAVTVSASEKPSVAAFRRTVGTSPGRCLNGDTEASFEAPATGAVPATGAADE